MTTTPLLIGLTGRAGAGKSTVAAHLEAEWAFEPIAFADPILAMAAALFSEAGIDGAWATERALKEQPTPVLGVSYRRLAQTLGTDWGRHMIATDLWLRVAAHKVQQARLHDLSVVISDVRFPNEAQWVLEQGGLLVRVTRPDLPPLADDAAMHASEYYADRLPAHAELLNGASIPTLCDRVDDLVRKLRRQMSAGFRALDMKERHGGDWRPVEHGFEDSKTPNDKGKRTPEARSAVGGPLDPPVVPL